MREAIKAPIVLTVICASVCALLAFANDLTDEKIDAAAQQQLQDTLSSTFGEAEYTTLSQSFDGINQVIRDTENRVIFDITSSGYTKDGQHLLIGIGADGAVCGVTVVSISDSPSQAKSVQADTFLSQFIGLTEPTPTYDAIAGATKSSDGIHAAVQLALETYTANKEALQNAQ